MPEAQTPLPGALDAFVTELIANGFELVPESAGSLWSGPVLPCFQPLTDAERMRVEIRDGWPFLPPYVRVEGLRSAEHYGGHDIVCLWRDNYPGTPWLHWPEVVERAEEWCRRVQRDGFRPGDLAADAFLVFRDGDPMLATFNLSTLCTAFITGKSQRIHAIQDESCCTVDLRPGKGPRGSASARLFFVGELRTAPTNHLELEAALTPQQVERLRRDISRSPGGPEPPIEFVLLCWRNQGVLDAVVLRVTTGREDGPYGLRSLEPAPTDPATLVNRGGPEFRALQRKRVTLFGVGSVGSHVALSLAECGVGRLLLVDGDRLRPGNVVRHLSGRQGTGCHKAVLTATIIRSHVATTEVTWDLRSPFGSRDIWTIIQGSDCVVDCTGVWPAQQLLALVAQDAGIDLVSAALYRQGGVGRVRRQARGDVPILTRGARQGYVQVPEAADPKEEVVEIGCTDPVNTAPPSSALALAGTTVQVVVATLTGFRDHPEDLIAVYRPLPEAPFDEVGIIKCPWS